MSDAADGAMPRALTDLGEGCDGMCSSCSSAETGRAGASVVRCDDASRGGLITPNWSTYLSCAALASISVLYRPTSTGSPLSSTMVATQDERISRTPPAVEGPPRPPPPRRARFFRPSAKVPLAGADAASWVAEDSSQAFAVAR